jgi:hypothetical protein
MKKNYFIYLFMYGSVLFSQTITGVVRNAAGLPIKQALVCQKNNTSIFAKTDVNGNFSLAGTVGTLLRIGALKYDTIYDFAAPSTTGVIITMSNDPLLATDVFHISFDHLRPGPTYTKQELKDDFSLAYTSGFYEGTPDTDRASVDYNVSRDVGGVSLKVRFPQGKLKTADSGIDTRIDLKGTFNTNDFQSEDLYLSYWVKFSDNFEFNKCGGKLPSLGGSTYNSTQDRWKGRIMWRKGGAIQFYMELPDNSFSPDNDARFWGTQVVPGSDICTFEYQPYLSQPGWHNIELHYKFETPGMNDGLFEGWVDGANNDMINASVFNNYRPAGTTRANITINTILLSAFLGGTDVIDYAPTQDTFAWFDEFRVSSQRINEWSFYNGTLGVNDVAKKNRINVYPNPSKNGLFSLDDANDWSVFDVLGKKVAEGMGSIINLEKQSKGIYFLKIDNTISKIIMQ